MKITRDGIAYNVIAETDSEVCVEAEIKYCDGTQRMVRCWWDKTLVNGEEEL